MMLLASLLVVLGMALTLIRAVRGPTVYDRILAEVERPLISICLAATRGNQIKAAHLLGLNRNTLRKKIKDLGLEVIRGLCAE